MFTMSRQAQMRNVRSNVVVRYEWSILQSMGDISRMPVVDRCNSGATRCGGRGLTGPIGGR